MRAKNCIAPTTARLSEGACEATLKPVSAPNRQPSSSQYKSTKSRSLNKRRGELTARARNHGHSYQTTEAALRSHAQHCRSNELSALEIGQNQPTTVRAVSSIPIPQDVPRWLVEPK